MKGPILVNPHDETGEIAPADAPAGSASLVARVLDAIAWTCMLAAGSALVVIIVTFGWLVFGRYVLNDTPTWIEQLALLLVSYITFLGAAVGVRRNSHLSIDFVREGLPALPRMVMRHLCDLTVIVFGAAMAWEGWTLFSTNLDRMIPMLGVAESWRALPMAICGVLMVIFCGSNVVARLRGGSEGDA